ncbi:MAG: hypothetical protein LBE57_05180 [Methanosarcinales archaeon]|nr:hypothetical protein [Methanosarcinales archaeon]
MLCIIAHFLYHAWYLGQRLPMGLLFIGMWSPTAFLYSTLSSKKVRTPDYSKSLSYIGIFVSICMFLIYCSYFLGIFLETIQNEIFLLVAFMVFVAYIGFLSWYKRGWWDIWWEKDVRK